MNSKNFKKIGIVVLILLFLGVGYTVDKFYGWNKIFDTVNLSYSLEDNYKMGVHFIDVGKADCSYIKCENADILIDAGDLDSFSGVVKYLKRKNVKKLDLVIATHPHRDHIGQMCDVIDNFDIDCFLTSKVSNKKDEQIPLAYSKMLEALDRKNIKVKIAKPGQTIKISDLYIEILGPQKEYDNINDNSVVAKIIYGSLKFLFMGDAQKTSEKDLINSKLDLKSDVIKIGHHGSKTSTSEEFLRLVNPKYAVIFSGPNKQGLPKKDILKRLNDFSIEVFRTDLMGDILFLSNGNKIDEIITQKIAA